MATSLFVTGGTGFIGREVIRRVSNAGFRETVGLSRKGPEAEATEGARWLRGDLLEADTYRDALGPSTVVLHLAAATGNAPAREHQRVNVDGTQVLLRACREQGVAHLVFVSSIAARYADLRSYPYGRAKRDAEALVVQSGVSHVIVRPTIVLGQGSSIWHRFRQMAALPVVPLFGSGKTRVQPIHVDDVANALVRFAQGKPDDPLVELGGPDALALSELLARIHRLDHKRDPRFMRIPFAPLRRTLELLEPWAGGFMPVTAGQLSVFVNDSTVQVTPTLRELWPRMKTIDQMLEALRS